MVTVIICLGVYFVGVFFSMMNWVMDHTFGGKDAREYRDRHGNYRGYTLYTLKFFWHTLFWLPMLLLRFIIGIVKGK